MTLAGYFARCDELIRELTGSLSTTDIDLLRSDCAAQGFAGWKQWMAHNLITIAQYTRAVPSKRAATKKWSDPALRRRLVLAGYWYLLGGRIFLEEIERQDIHPGAPYREIACRAAEAFLNIYEQRLVFWPFGDPDPFE